jgi:hypothetical protein
VRGLQPLILFLQYNYVAARLGLSFPEWLDNTAGAVQLLFSSSTGITSLDCLLKDESSAPLQRALINVAIPFALLLVTLAFWMLRCTHSYIVYLWILSTVVKQEPNVLLVSVYQIGPSVS